MRWGMGRWLGPAVGGLGLALSACFGGGATAPPPPTPVPTVVQVPTVPRAALDTPVPQTTATVVAGAQNVHEVRAGETLGQIALRYYGDANRWQRIYDANRAAIPNPNALTVGVRLTIPPP